MFKVALVLFKHTLGKSEILEECPTLYETMERLRHIPSEIMEEEFISKEVSDVIILYCVIRTSHFGLLYKHTFLQVSSRRF